MSAARKPAKNNTATETPPAAKAATGKPRTPRRRVSEKRERANQALRAELHTLRTELARIIEGLEVRVGGRIADMLRTLEGDDTIDQPPRFLTTAQAQAALDEIAAVRLDPDGSRMRDLRRIQKLVRRLRDRIPE